MKELIQTPAAINPDGSGNFFTAAISWDSIALDTSLYHKFFVGPNINELRPMSDGFSCIPDGQVYYQLEKPGLGHIVNVYRFRTIGGGYLTASIDPDEPGGLHLSYNSVRIEGTGSGLQRFIAIQIPGQYHFLMPFYFNSILYIKGSTVTDYNIGVERFDSNRLASGGYDRPYLIEFGYDSLPQRVHRHDGD